MRFHQSAIGASMLAGRTRLCIDGRRRSQGPESCSSLSRQAEKSAVSIRHLLSFNESGNPHFSQKAREMGHPGILTSWYFGILLLRLRFIIRYRWQDDDIAALFPVRRSGYLVLGGELDGIEHAQYLVEVAAGA